MNTSICDDYIETELSMDMSGPISSRDYVDVSQKEKKKERREKKKQDKIMKRFSKIDNRDDPTDYDAYCSFMYQIYRNLEKLDAAGRTFYKIFGLDKNKGEK